MARWASGNIFIHEMIFECAGKPVPGHDHRFDHTTYVVRGALRIEKLKVVGDKLEVERVVEKRATDGENWVLIKAGVHHRITALEDNSLGHCIYSHRNENGEIVAEYKDGWEMAYE